MTPMPAIVLALVLASSAGPVAGGPSPLQPTRVNPLAATLKDFGDRLDAYDKLRKQVEGKVGPLKKTDDPAAIAQRQRAIGEGIRQARADAKAGDLFTPPVADAIRRFIARDLARRKPVDRRAFVVSQPDVSVRVNESYPAGVPFATVPPRLLKQLPVLPEGLEYRFVGSTLILRDVDANLVVDLLPDAIPERYRKR